MQAIELHTLIPPLDTHGEAGWVQLYKCQPPADRLGDASPPIRVDLVAESTVKGLLALLAVFFPQRECRRIKVEWGAAWLELRRGLCPTLLKDSTDLIDLIPELNEWLNDWATSHDRGADCRPPWAQARGIDEDSVSQIAGYVVKHLANSSQRTLSVANETGREAELRVPPRPRLIAPKSSNLSDTEIFVVDDTQPVTIYMTRSGKAVISICFDADGTDSADSVEINPRMLKRVSITSSRSLRPLSSEGEKEDPA